VSCIISQAVAIPRPDVPAPDRQLPYPETKPLLPKDIADYERAATEFPEHFDTYFKSETAGRVPNEVDSRGASPCIFRQYRTKGLLPQR
jgi:hypothetical protein